MQVSFGFLMNESMSASLRKTQIIAEIRPCRIVGSAIRLVKYNELIICNSTHHIS